MSDPGEVPLDFIMASLGASQSVRPNGVPVQNNPPNIIVSNTPALLVMVQGAPVVKPVTGTKLQRVINTRALILRNGTRPPYYLHVYDGWMKADTVDGPWQVANNPPASLNATAAQLSKNGAVDLLDGGPNAEQRLALANGAPTIYVAYTPTELIVFTGQPDFCRTPGRENRQDTAGRVFDGRRSATSR